MQILNGIYTHCVLQRNRKGLCDAVINLKSVSGTVTVEVKRGNRIIQGVSVKSIGKNRLQLKGIPTGGPYTVQFSDETDIRTVNDILVGDVWILAGQSNMEGVGLLKDKPKAHPEVRNYYMDNRWAVAREPLHNMNKAAASVHKTIKGGDLGARKTVTGVGPGHAFGLEMQRLTKVPQGLIACAHGGTSMSQWDPALKKKMDESLYGAAIERLKANGNNVAGMIWYQGESDANADAAGLYTQRMKKLMSAFRRDTKNPKLPIVIVQISRVVGHSITDGIYWNRIQEQQRKLPEKIKNLAAVPAIHLSMDDFIHISGKSQQVLGKQLAHTMRHLRGVRKNNPLPIELGDIRIIETQRLMADIEVSFRNCKGKLQSGGRPAGFSLNSSIPVPGIIDAELKGNKVLIHTGKTVNDLNELGLQYGPGCDPFCNIVDQGGRSLPVFGPIPLGKPRALTPFIRTMRISKPQKPVKNIASLKKPADFKGMGMKRYAFETDFCDIRSHYKEGDHLLYYVCEFSAAESMRLQLLLGYDGPIKVWVDGKSVFCDPKGTNPAMPTDKGRALFNVKKGKHSVITAFSTNKGRAWGAYFRLERLDVRQMQLKKGPDGYLLPEVKG